MKKNHHHQRRKQQQAPTSQDIKKDQRIRKAGLITAGLLIITATIIKPVIGISILATWIIISIILHKRMTGGAN